MAGSAHPAERRALAKQLLAYDEENPAMRHTDRQAEAGATSARWEFEAHTYSRSSDDGLSIEEHPTGWVTFRCGCGRNISGRTAETTRQAYDHLTRDHPDWEQIPEPATSSAVPEEDRRL